MDSLEDLLVPSTPTAKRPLLGLTVLVVEDSRFACEAVRLLCLRSGARIRRADSLEHAHRHLGVYRPSVLIVDVGLPDGSGLALIDSFSHATPRIDVILGTSGDLDVEGDVLSAGADGFIGKPIASLAAFQTEILRHLPRDRQPPGPRVVSDERVNPDIIAFHDDLSHVVQVLQSDDAAQSVGYVAQFLGGVAQSVSDNDLHQAAAALALDHAKGAPTAAGLAQLGAMVQSRLENVGPM